MTDQQRQETFTLSTLCDMEPVLGLTSASASGWLQERRGGRGKEREYEAHLKDLQRYLCELLIKNQQLRELLESATNHRSQESASEYDQNRTRN